MKTMKGRMQGNDGDDEKMETMKVWVGWKGKDNKSMDILQE